MFSSDNSVPEKVRKMQTTVKNKVILQQSKKMKILWKPRSFYDLASGNTKRKHSALSICKKKQLLIMKLEKGASVKLLQAKTGTSTYHTWPKTRNV
jgi:hypothetical protein